MTTTIGLKLDERTQERLQKLGNAKERSPHWLMKDAIERYLTVEEQVERERAEDRARYERFLDTGEHIEHGDMIAWLSKQAGAAARKASPSKRAAKTRAVSKRPARKRR